MSVVGAAVGLTGCVTAPASSPAAGPTPTPVPSTSTSRATDIPSKWVKYTVQSGDTWRGLSRRHGVDMQELARRNGMKWTDTLYAGETQLWVPPVKAKVKPSTETSSPSALAVLLDGGVDPMLGLLSEAFPTYDVKRDSSQAYRWTLTSKTGDSFTATVTAKAVELSSKRDGPTSWPISVVTEDGLAEAVLALAEVDPRAHPLNVVLEKLGDDGVRNVLQQRYPNDRIEKDPKVPHAWLVTSELETRIRVRFVDGQMVLSGAVPKQAVNVPWTITSKSFPAFAIRHLPLADRLDEVLQRFDHRTGGIEAAIGEAAPEYYVQRDPDQRYAWALIDKHNPEVELAVSIEGRQLTVDAGPAGEAPALLTLPSEGLTYSELVEAFRKGVNASRTVEPEVLPG